MPILHPINRDTIHVATDCENLTVAINQKVIYKAIEKLAYMRRVREHNCNKTSQTMKKKREKNETKRKQRKQKQNKTSTVAVA